MILRIVAPLVGKPVPTSVLPTIRPVVLFSVTVFTGGTKVPPDAYVLLTGLFVSCAVMATVVNAPMVLN